MELSIIAGKTSLSLLTDRKSIEVVCDSIKRRGEKLDSDIQLAALSVINHLDVHGDITLVQRLYEAMPRGSRRNALVCWFLLYGKVRLNEDKNTSKTQPFKFDKTKQTKLEEGNSTPWYECKKEKEPLEEFNLLDQLARLLKKAEKAQQDGVVVLGGDFLGEIKTRLEKGDKVISMAPVQDTAQANPVEVVTITEAP